MALANDPSSHWRKLARGIEQVEALCGEAVAFKNDDAYTFEKEIESRTAQEVMYRCFAVQRKPVPPDWPLRSGEAIQNLRSSLDHVVYKASGERSRAQFPIFIDACEFQVYGGRMLRGVPASMRAAIEWSQPYIRMPDAPTQDALALLRTLSNHDKHRALATVATSVQTEGAGVPDGANLRWKEFATNRPLGAGKAHISTIVVTFEQEAEQVDVETFFSYEVSIEGRPFDHLEWIANEVFRVVSECESGKKLSPFASYPIQRFP